MSLFLDFYLRLRTRIESDNNSCSFCMFEGNRAGKGKGGQSKACGNNLGGKARERGICIKVKGHVPMKKRVFSTQKGVKRIWKAFREKKISWLFFQRFLILFC